MTTIPHAMAQVALSRADDHDRALLSGLLSAAGDVDLHQVHQLSPALAQALAEYEQRCRRFWWRARRGHDVGAHVTTRQPLTEAVQSTTKGAKKDLTAELDDLLALPGIGPVVHEATDSEPDFARLLAQAAPLRPRLHDTGKARVLTLHASPDLHWPQSLGGVASANEIVRVLEITVMHAAWRDRRVRRLSAVSSAAVLLWPAPAAVQAPVMAAA